MAEITLEVRTATRAACVYLVACVKTAVCRRVSHAQVVYPADVTMDFLFDKLKALRCVNTVHRQDLSLITSSLLTHVSAGLQVSTRGEAAQVILFSAAAVRVAQRAVYAVCESGALADSKCLAPSG